MSPHERDAERNAERDAERLRSTLEAVALADGFRLSETVLAGCGVHFTAMCRWNRTHNLTRVTEPEVAAVYHYYDALRPLVDSDLRPTSFLDIGSGAGFPGLMAALFWDVPATLVEPARKRVSFLTLAAKAMGVDVTVVDPETTTGSLVLSRATFPPEAGSRLWRYVEAGGQLVVWSTSGDESMWREVASTWVGATFTCRNYHLTGVGDRRFLQIRASSSS